MPVALGANPELGRNNSVPLSKGPWPRFQSWAADRFAWNDNRAKSLSSFHLIISRTPGASKPRWLLEVLGASTGDT